MAFFSLVGSAQVQTNTLRVSMICRGKCFSAFHELSVFKLQFLSAKWRHDRSRWPCDLRRRSEAASIAGFAGSNPAEGMVIRLLYLLCVV